MDDFLLPVLIAALGVVASVFAYNRGKRSAGNPDLSSEINDAPLPALDGAERIRELERLRTAFYTNITHEFRTPLTVISGMASMIEENPKEAEESIEMIRRNSASLLTLVNQMLDLSKLDSGAMKVKMSRGDITAHLNYIVESLASFADQQGVELHCQHEHSPFDMDFDGEKIMQVVSNLISNGVKYTPEGGKVELWTHSTKAGGVEQFHISVTDSGIGIGSEHLPYIFSRFYRVEDTAIKASKGTGVGLALTKDLVELMEGEIDVKSETGAGATFVVTLPVRREAASDAGRITQEEIISASAAYLTGKGPTDSNEESAIIDTDIPLILIIEDNADVATYISKCLKPTYRIAYAPDGEAGIKKALEHVPDFVITDVMMPKKDGFEVCSTLKNDERTSHIPLIMLTAKADMESKIEGLQTGADAYLSKPFNKEELLVRVKNLIELRQLLQKRYNTGEPPDESEGLVIEDKFILRLNDVIKEHLDDADFGGTLLAREMMLSRSQLHNKIKALTGRSTALYMRYIRLLEARDMLKNPDLNISEIAYDVGFKDPAYFTRCYKEEFGMAPSAAR